METENDSRGGAEKHTTSSWLGLSRPPITSVREQLAQNEVMDGRHEGGHDGLMDADTNSRLRVPSSSSADQIVEIARGWIGTPYIHQASMKGVGCDCLGLLRGVWRELYGEEPERPPAYSPDWAEAAGTETLYMALKRHLTELALPAGGAIFSSPVHGGGGTHSVTEGAALSPGDIALFRMNPRGPAKHCGIIARSHPSYEARSHPPPEGGGSGSVPTSKFASANFGEGTLLTLIHARQNKRVSEEPLSQYWRSKLAYAFRVESTY